MELRAQKPLEKIKVKELCDLACINKSTFYAHYQDIYALANAMEDEMVEVVVESLPQLTARDVSERTEWLTREMFRAFTRKQTEIGILFSGSRQGLFINRVEAAMSKCISESDPSFDADVVRKIVLSFCVQGSTTPSPATAARWTKSGWWLCLRLLHARRKKSGCNTTI